MNQRDTFINAVHNCAVLPELVRNAASSVVGIETSTFDKTYLEFLEQQVELNARGDEWSQRLRLRRSGLADWCDVQLINGRIKVDTDDYAIKVDRSNNAIGSLLGTLCKRS